MSRSAHVARRPVSRFRLLLIGCGLLFGAGATALGAPAAEPDAMRAAALFGGLQMPSGQAANVEADVGASAAPGLGASTGRETVRVQWPGGHSYEGALRAGRPHGEGTMVWPDGHRYQGLFESGTMSGEGRFEFVSGSRYTGELADGMPHGLGTLRLPDRTRFTGEYDLGLRQGWGEYRLADGTRYVGEYHADLRHGQGTLISSEGDLFRGAFRDDAEHGVGVRVSPNGSSLTLEVWENGVRQRNQAIRSSASCQLDHAGRRWMVVGSDCVDGLAHGRGGAVSTDGTLWLERGRFVLGRLVLGHPIALGQPPENDS